MTFVRSKPKVMVADLGTGMQRNLLPLSAGLIASYARCRPPLDAAFDIDVHFLDRDHASFLPAWGELAVLGLACYVWNLNASMRLAAAVRERYPEALVVVGGPSAPVYPERIEWFFAQHPYVDVLVHGEGEATFAGILDAVRVGSGLADVPGISFRAPGAYLTTPARERIVDLASIPSPYLNGLFDAVLARHGHRITGALIETARGCPHSCAFCEWGSAHRNRVVKHDLPRVFAELDWISRHRIFYTFSADSNFGLFRDRDLRIAEYVARRHEQNGFPAHFFANWTKKTGPELCRIADALVRGGVSTLTTMSVQSLNDETVRLIKRRNMPKEEQAKLKAEFHKRGHITYTEFILGLPAETLETFRRGLALAMTPHLNDWFCLYICQLVETSEMASPENRKRFGFQTRSCELGIHFHPIDQDNAGEVLELVVGTASMPTEAWRCALVYGYFVWSLYFYRTAFFVANYLHSVHGIDPAVFIDFILADVRRAPGAYPVLCACVDLLDRQCDKLLEGGKGLMTVDGFGDMAFLPQEAVTLLTVHRSEAFADELERLTRACAAAHAVDVNDERLDEVLRYQRLRIPTTRTPSTEPERFRYSIPAFFDVLTKGESPPAIMAQETWIRVVAPADLPEPGVGLVISRMRTSMGYVPYETEQVGAHVRQAP